MIRLECCAELADKVALKWSRSFSDYEGYYSEIPDSFLKYIVTNVREVSKDISTLLKPFRFGRQCIFTGRCSFIGVPDVTTSVFTWQSGNTNYGVEFFFSSSIDNERLGRVFFYLETGKLEFKYSPYIVIRQSQSDYICTALEILSSRKKNAVSKIECAFLKAKFRPNYILCKKLLLKDLECIYKQNQALLINT